MALYIAECYMVIECVVWLLELYQAFTPWWSALYVSMY